jgi:hypothetical protein
MQVLSDVLVCLPVEVYIKLHISVYVGDIYLPVCVLKPEIRNKMLFHQKVILNIPSKA